MVTIICRSFAEDQGTRRDMQSSVAGLLLSAALLVAAGPAVAQQLAAASSEARHSAYVKARTAYEAQATAYWNSISEKRRTRFAKRRNNEVVGLDDYVLT